MSVPSIILRSACARVCNQLTKPPPNKSGRMRLVRSPHVMAQIQIRILIPPINGHNRAGRKLQEACPAWEHQNSEMTGGLPCQGAAE